ncbi:MAG: type II toxin-antitoxin system RatA family toxin [Pseudomonadales bacterium]|nr:type II toxin-antitoxin system RatA family toxin [Gammaproteobacteria bacterium]
MATLERSALVPFSAERMFVLVNDVRRYPEFVPWCAGAEVLVETDALIEASLRLKRGGVEHRFTTRNSLTPFTAMRLELVDGPFTTFTGDWAFKALGEDACKIGLTLTFQYRGRLATAALGALLSSSADTLVEAFCQRAKALYG